MRRLRQAWRQAWGLVPIFALSLGFAVDAVQAADLKTADLTLQGPLTQGGLVIGETMPGTRAALNGAPLRVSPEGRFVFGFDRDYQGPARLTVTWPDGRIQTRTLAVTSRAYDIQRIDGLPPKYVSPPPEELARIKREGAEKRAARNRDTDADWFAHGFIWPAQGRISGVFGSQRFYNGEPRRPHYGVDVAGPEGTPVVAPASGIVRLADPDFYFEGGVIFIDHGYGVTGVLMHLGRVDVAVGDKVEQGQTVGAIGATGRATGAHVDWRIYWRDAHVDPQLLVGPMSASIAATE